MNRLNIIRIFTVFSLFMSCSSGSPGEPYKMPYASQEELASRTSPCNLIPDRSSWILQYPSGEKDKGILTASMGTDFKNRYFSKYTAADGQEYIRFSLDGSDQGKTTNGSSVRVELAQTGNSKWALSGEHCLEYSFWGTTTDISIAKITVGQFLASRLPDPKENKPTDRPLCRIEINRGELYAVVRNYYEKDAVDDSKGDPIKFDLGSWEPSKKTTIRIETSDKKITIYRDGKNKGSTTFTEKVYSDARNYFKAGLYYGNKESPQLFSELYIQIHEVK